MIFSKIEKLKNTFTALLTPFDNDDDLAKDIFRKFVRKQIDAGAGLVPCGSTGESPTLSHEEHEDVIRWCIEEASLSSKKPFVLAGTGSNSTKEALNLSLNAEKMGADGILSVVPYYNKPTQRGLIQHFSAIAEAISIPLVIYNIPGRTGINLLPDSMAELANKYDNIVGYKAAEGNLDQIKQVIEKCPKNLVVFSGDDALTYNIMRIGGKGTISVASNIIPERMVRFTEMMERGEWDAAKRENDSLQELYKILTIEQSPSPAKYIAELLGLMSSTVRLPLVTPEVPNKSKIRESLKRLQLLA